MNEIIRSENKISAQQAFPFESEIIAWNLEHAIQQCRTHFADAQDTAALLAKDLFIAHEVLSVRGGDRKSEDAPAFTFTDFIEAVGISRKTAYLWLKLYNPVEDRIMPPEEVSAAPAKKAIAQTSWNEERVVHAMETGERLAGWTQFDEAEFKKRAANRHFSEQAAMWGKKLKIHAKVQRDYFGEAMKNVREYSRFTLATREQTAAQFEVFDHLKQYLETFVDPGTRLAASYNIGLKIREIINEMASQMAELSQFDSVEVN